MTTTKTRPWDEFMGSLEAHLGSPKRAQTNFCEQTEYSLSTLQHWRKSNKVPEAAFEALASIDPETCSSSYFQGYHTGKFTNRLIALSADNKSLAEIASTLSSEYNRKVTENMVKGIRYRNKERIETYRSRPK